MNTYQVTADPRYNNGDSMCLGVALVKANTPKMAVKVAQNLSAAEKARQSFKGGAGHMLVAKKVQFVEA